MSLSVSVQKANSSLSLSYFISILKVEPFGIFDKSDVFTLTTKDQPLLYFNLEALLNSNIDIKGIPLCLVLYKKRCSFETQFLFNFINSFLL